MTQPAAFFSHPGITYAQPATGPMAFGGPSAPWGASSEEAVTTAWIYSPYSVPFRIADRTGTRLNPEALKKSAYTESTETTGERAARIDGQTNLIQMTDLAVARVLGNLKPLDLVSARLTCKTLYVLSFTNDVVQNSLRTILPNLNLRSPCMFSFSAQFEIICHHAYGHVNDLNRLVRTKIQKEAESALNVVLDGALLPYDNQEQYDRMITTQEQFLNDNQ